MAVLAAHFQTLSSNQLMVDLIINLMVTSETTIKNTYPSGMSNCPTNCLRLTFKATCTALSIVHQSTLNGLLSDKAYLNLLLITARGYPTSNCLLRLIINLDVSSVLVDNTQISIYLIDL